MTRLSTSSRPVPVRPSSRTQSWVRLLSSSRHGDVLRPASATPRSIFFTAAVLRACGEPC